MRAKLVHESYKDVLKPKTKEEIRQVLLKLSDEKKAEL